MRFKNDDGKFTKTVKIITTVCTVIGVLISLGTATVKVSRMNAWDSELESLESRVDHIVDEQVAMQCEYINKELNLIRAKERSEDLKAYDLFWRDELESRKEELCNRN